MRYFLIDESCLHLNLEYLQHFIAVVVDHLDGDSTSFRRIKRAAGGRVQFRPGRLVNLGPERPLELVVGIARTREVSVAHEEALAIIVGIDEPAGNIVGGVRANLAGGRVVDVEAP